MSYAPELHKAHETYAAPRLLRLPQVIERTGLGRTTIYDSIRSGVFPRPVALTKAARAWRSDEIDAWIAQRCAARDAQAAA